METVIKFLEKVKDQRHNINIISGVLHVDPTILYNALDTAIKDVKIINVKIDELIEELRPPQ